MPESAPRVLSIVWNLIRGGTEGQCARVAMGLAERPLRMYQVRTENGEVHVLMDKELVYDYDDDW